jgi:uncharacterized protein DUF4872/butirosin biosynthesis protein H-like
VKTIDSYKHQVASHCETGSVRNLLGHAGLEISEPMVFGIGSGPAFFYLFFAKGPSGFPMIGIRNPPGSILKNVGKLCKIDFKAGSLASTEQALGQSEKLIAGGTPVAAIVDMFYMKYLPSFLHIHAPFHTILLVGHEGDEYAVSDPYAEEICTLKTEDLAAAWETHATLAKDNFIAHVDSIPASIDWKSAIKSAIRKTCNGMLLPPVIKSVFSFVGIEGMKTYAKKMREWPDKYRGVRLREGILFNAVGFEDQGTGGGAFRPMYGAFLQEVADMFDAPQFAELADKILDHGQKWRNISVKLIKVGKQIPQDNDAFDDWMVTGRSSLESGLAECSDLFKERAAFEFEFFKELKAAAARL